MHASDALPSRGNLIRQPDGVFVHEKLVPAYRPNPTPPMRKMGETKAEKNPKSEKKGDGPMPGWLQPVIKWGLIVVLVMFTSAFAVPFVIGSTARWVCAWSQGAGYALGCGVSRSFATLQSTGDDYRPAAGNYRQQVPPGERRRAVQAPPPMRASIPQIDCAAAGGTRTINPHTGKPSCFVVHR